MIEVQIGPTVFKCSSPEEAVRVHLLVTGGTIAEPSAPRPTPTGGSTPSPSKKGGRARAFVKKLEQVPVGQQLDTQMMVKLTAVKGPNGIGPRLAQFRKSLRAENIVLDDMIEKTNTDAPGPAVWVRKAAPQRAAA